MMVFKTETSTKKGKKRPEKLISTQIHDNFFRTKCMNIHFRGEKTQ